LDILNLIGKNLKKPNVFFRFYARDIVDKIMEFNSYIDVYVIPNSIEIRRNENHIKKNKTKFIISLKEILISSLIMLISALATLFIDKLGYG